ncbi:hypothetical protein [Idiomarina tyrosinivorans]|uniref:hypothetical protein n=1 Tax=Idiomarina tyrosinivorans TaxID=1445662 RepID=UPI001300385E|nr:hypothetical protein [Idiomarina tyrosinivorans]
MVIALLAFCVGLASFMSGVLEKQMVAVVVGLLVMLVSVIGFALLWTRAKKRQ